MKTAKAPRRPTGFHIVAANGGYMRPTDHSAGRFLEPSKTPHAFRGQTHTSRMIERTNTLLRKLETSLIADAPPIRALAAQLRAASPLTAVPIDPA